jgi:RimJ/RimL family protein N-acetyltransferase
MTFGWSDGEVRLVPLDRQRHLENAVRWLNDPEITRFMLTGDWPLTAGGEEQWFKAADENDGTAAHFAIELADGTHLGFSGLMHIDFRHGSAHTGSFLGRRDLWGRGLGTRAARIRSRYAFEGLGLRILLADALVDNHASVRMLAKVGYTERGRIARRYWKSGALRDAVILALERAEVG